MTHGRIAELGGGESDVVDNGPYFFGYRNV
jgi:hypothetical protein